MFIGTYAKHFSMVLVITCVKNYVKNGKSSALLVVS